MFGKAKIIRSTWLSSVDMKKSGSQMVKDHFMLLLRPCSFEHLIPEKRFSGPYDLKSAVLLCIGTAIDSVPFISRVRAPTANWSRFGYEIHTHQTHNLVSKYVIWM